MGCRMLTSDLNQTLAILTTANQIAILVIPHSLMAYTLPLRFM